MSVIVDYDRQFTGTVSACGSTMGNGNVIRPDLLTPIQTPASEDSGRCRHWVTFRWPCFVLEGDDLVAPFQASWPAASEPSEGSLGQASTLARERCLAGPADPSGQADQRQHPLWLEAVVTPRRPEPLVGSGLVTALRHGLSLGYRGDVAL